ncbi:hypothetical protein [Candidatus Stoquefichus massiliensis]|uniref:hypothetical protein n=1 Tax=Candidatus Stoquefichus massiliensis TaxID=1470350 RepID=UPI0004801B97|nr:hypothetical protein [Candidatus Stoquefichus massiliensis]
MTRIQKLKILTMTILMLFLVFGTNFVMCRQLNSKSDATRIKNFYKLEKNSLDMILIGASTSFTDYSAPLAWKEFGYTSYSFATNMAPMGIAKSMLIEVRKTQKPKLFVIDINGILYNDEQESREGSNRLWIDNMPFSKNKIDTINELISEDQRLAYYFPLLKYHSNWPQLYDCLEVSMKELTDKDKTNLAAMGIQGTAKIDPQRHYVNIKEYNDTLPMHQLSGKHLKDLLEYCKKEKLSNVIFTNMPRYYSKKMLPERKRNNSAKALIKEYGYECIDMDDYVDEIGLNPEKDYYNPNHLNIYGQKKLTKYFGKLINERFQLSQTQHSESVKKRYDYEFISYQKVYDWADSYIKRKKSKRYNYEEVKEILSH